MESLQAVWEWQIGPLSVDIYLALKAKKTPKTNKPKKPNVAPVISTVIPPSGLSAFQRFRKKTPLCVPSFDVF